MRVIARRTLVDFQEKHPDAKEPLDAWYHIVRRKKYQRSHEVQEDFGSASFLGDGITVFNIGGNTYRLVVRFRYDIGMVFVRRVMTHAEYSQATADGTLLARRQEGA